MNRRPQIIVYVQPMTIYKTLSQQKRTLRPLALPIISRPLYLQTPKPPANGLQAIGRKYLVVGLLLSYLKEYIQIINCFRLLACFPTIYSDLSIYLSIYLYSCLSVYLLRSFYLWGEPCILPVYYK